MSISRQTLFGKLDATLFRSIESATVLCKLRGNPYVELVHWLHQLLRLPDGDLHRIIRGAGIDRDALERDTARALAALPAGASSISDFSHHVDTAIERAWVLATLSFGDSRIRGAWLIAALAATPELRRLMTSISPAFATLPVDGLDATLRAWISGSPETDEGAYDGGGLAPALPGDASDSMPGTTNRPTLEQYCVDLTERARQGAIDPVIGRALDIRTMIDVLMRRRQNNPLLTGEAGVGKTAVVEGLALAIAAGDVPPQLADARLMSLDVGALLAGASMKGEFEARLKGVLESATKSPSPIVLFIDEIHTLIGAGGQAGTGDAANLLKPALARGTLRTIGATTWSEYKRHIEKDPALTRRFQVLQIAEPDEAAAIDMVRGLARRFASHHGVTVLDEAIRSAVRLSHRYIPARQLPDKAISLIDTACARVALSQHAPPRELQDLRQRLVALRAERDLLDEQARLGIEASGSTHSVNARIESLEAEECAIAVRWNAQRSLVARLAEVRREALDVEDSVSTDTLRELSDALSDLQGEAPLVFPEVDAAVVAEIVADWTGIPVGRMVANEMTAIRGLYDTLATRVIGQPDALRLIAERVQTARTGLADPKKPLGVFMLAGPSGVGKTETALALADALYGGEQNLITINMSEYQEAHTVSGLKGAPPGYVGYGEGGVLTEAVRRRPYSVVLLDEIEKAHRDVHEMFFQVFDKGYMEDGDGRYIDFRNTTIILTSNAGAELTASLCADPALEPDGEGLSAALEPELLKTFPAAFIGRVSVVPYRPLASASLARIVRLHLDRVVDRMQSAHRIVLEISASVVAYIVDRCLVQETGARVLIGFIERHVLPRLSMMWLDAASSKTPLARIDVDIADAGAQPAEALSFSAVSGQATESVFPSEAQVV
ncbi:type VI secretion system ATPase TssH [Burkholderia stagnalis]|uniref:type VI secretion system ATPase TssH n=1 Tax=Burkholderia stagnalis TaxID=1503054 RepID=UPI002AB45C28|nr:type VI secretion system ATPase TssH [Burkholderia stagnalis]MDY7801522.1 type VI secretion system ATPase TssH [Burkholderia stagnalis]